MAATTGAIRAGRAFVEIFGDDSKLQQTFAGVQRRMRAFGRSLTTIGAGLVGGAQTILAPLTAAAFAFGKAGAALDDASGRTGASVEALSELSFAAEQSGASLSDVEAGLRGMARFTKTAAAGGKSAVATLKALGISAGELDGMSPDQQMARLADGLARIEDPTKRAALAMQVFGKSGTTLLPMFADGAAGLEALRKQARDLGVVMSTEDAKAAAEFDDAMAALWTQAKQIVVTIGSAVAPVFTTAARLLQTLAKSAIDFVKENREVIRIAFFAAVGVTVFGTAMIAAGIACTALATAVGGFAAVLGAIAAAVSFLISPIGLLTVAVVGLGAGIVHTSGAGAAAIEWLKDAFGALAAESGMAFDAIKAALAGGDFGAAARVLWSTLKMWFTKGKSEILSIWQSIRDPMLKTWFDIQEAIGGAWIKTVTFIGRKLDEMSGGILKAWNSLVGELAALSLEAEGFLTGDETTKAAADFARQDAANKNAAIDAGTNSKGMAREAAAGQALDGLSRSTDLKKMAIDFMSSAEVLAAEGQLQKARQELLDAVNVAAATPALDMKKDEEQKSFDMNTLFDGAKQIGSFSANSRQFGADNKTTRLMEEQLDTLKSIDDRLGDDGITAE